MDYIDFAAGQTGENFWFKGKRELIDTLMKNIEGDNLKILNIGAGIGADLDILNKYGDIYVIDINQRALNLVPEHLCVEKKECDATKLDYPENFFDIVCSFDVFEHIENDSQAVSEILRVLKKGGFLFFTVPAFQILYSAHDRALLHFRRYNTKTLHYLLSAFHDIRMSYWNSSLFFPLSILRILKKKSKPQTDYFNLPKFLERFFLRLLRIENYIIAKKFKIPLGLSLVGSCRK
ncbi:MAG: class I SAM-dependent methyltransferase [Promethearchaeota archaeon]|jgi:ubiquinone/menaquinone biosynthesis C-methylase UbiE